MKPSTSSHYAARRANVKRISVIGTARIGAVPKARRSPSRSLAAALQPFVDAGTLAGAVVLVADRSKVLAHETVGWADVATRKPMRPDTLFWIASQTKSITAAAFMILVDKGLVRLNDPVERFLPEFKYLWVAVERDGDHVLLRRPRHPITVREILSHTSGMSFVSAMEQPTFDLLPLRDAVASYAMTPLDAQPGTRYQYSNAGINTAGRIIEVVSGMSYEDFLDQQLLKPLGMTDTTFVPSARQIAHLAKTYKPTADKTGLEETPITQLRYPLNACGRYPMPAGGLFSTAQDVARFCQMILRGGSLGGRRYLSQFAVNAMTRKQTPPDVADTYGLGWRMEDGIIIHGGANSTHMSIDPRRGLVLVFNVHHAGFSDGAEKSYTAFLAAAGELFGGTARRR